jgi:hypothetical protein
MDWSHDTLSLDATRRVIGFARQHAAHIFDEIAPGRRRS